MATKVTHSTPCRALAAGVAAFPIAAAARAEDASGVASSRMSYSRFLEYLDMGRVKKVGGSAVLCHNVSSAASLPLAVHQMSDMSLYTLAVRQALEQLLKSQVSRS